MDNNLRDGDEVVIEHNFDHSTSGNQTASNSTDSSGSAGNNADDIDSVFNSQGETIGGVSGGLNPVDGTSVDTVVTNPWDTTSLGDGGVSSGSDNTGSVTPGDGDTSGSTDTGSDLTEDEEREQAIERQYQLWMESLGGIDVIGRAPGDDPFVDAFSLLFSESLEAEDTPHMTLIVMLAGVLPFFILVGLFLTMIYLPETRLGHCLNRRKNACKECCCAKK